MAAQMRGAEEGGITRTSLSENRPSATAIAEEVQMKSTLENCAGKAKSPFVSAQAKSPVAWQLWGENALEMAKKQNKLVFMYIGYMSSHACQLMLKETFDNDEVARVLNEEYIPILVDSEERPDLKRIYESFLSAIDAAGGQPMNLVLIPDLKPFFGGSYFPAPGSLPPGSNEKDMLQILIQINKTWKEQETRCRFDVEKSFNKTEDWTSDGTHGSGDDSDEIEIESIEKALMVFRHTYDMINGGFNFGETKFPSPSKLVALLRLIKYPYQMHDIIGMRDVMGAQMEALQTLTKINRGGLHDHIGQGFFHYTLTKDWSLPAFEKTLSDNAQLLHVYLDAFLLTLRESSNRDNLNVVYGQVDYLMSNLGHKDGGFYSSEAADSFYRRGDSVMREGAYYLWTRKELDSNLAHIHPQASKILSDYYGVHENGNIDKSHDPNDEFLNQNVFKEIGSQSVIANNLGMSVKDVLDILTKGIETLKSHRDSERVRPAVDNKIVTSWNGMAIGAFARTGAVMRGLSPQFSAKCQNAAISAAKFIERELYDASTKTLYRMWRDGRSGTKGFAEDYAFLIEGLIDLYEATFDEHWLRWADELQATQISLFHDNFGGGAFFSTLADEKDVILRLKEGLDTEEPSCNSTTASNLFRLYSVLRDTTYQTLARQTLSAFEPEIRERTHSFPSLWVSIAAAEFGVKGVFVYQGEEKDSTGNRRIRDFEKCPRGSLGSFARLEKESSSWLRERNPLLKDFGGEDGVSKVLVLDETGRKVSVVPDDEEHIREQLDQRVEEEPEPEPQYQPQVENENSLTPRAEADPALSSGQPPAPPFVTDLEFQGMTPHEFWAVRN